MARRVAATTVLNERLRLSKAPAAEVAAAALDAQRAAELEGADFIVVAVDPDSTEEFTGRLRGLLEELDGPLPPAPPVRG